MTQTGKHLSDETILLLAEAELSRSDAVIAQAHLDGCAECKGRQDTLQRSLADYVEFARRPQPEEPSPNPNSRVLLQTRMRDLTISRQPWRMWVDAILLGSGRYVVYGCFLVLIAGLGLLWSPRSEVKQGVAIASFHTDGTPNRALTPGATRPVALADICPLGDDDLDPAVPVSTQRIVFAEYGIASDAATEDYQVDYLINPQLGGTNDVQNLWPEPYTSTVWNARVKDALEDRLHEMVCARTLDLASAQRDIATDWISAYKKYFHTPKPV